MNIHEYQAKELLRQYGVPVPAGSVAHSVEQAEAVAEELGVSRFVVKAQIHAGGRGKAGGVKLAHTVDEVRAATDEIIGRPLITAQTGPQGKLVQRVLIEQAVDIAREAYFGLVIDRASQRITIIACDGGGVDIEETARNEPARIVREAVDPAVGLLDFQCRKVAMHLGLGGKQLPAAVKLMKALYRCFRDNDAVLIEVNPLAVTLDGQLLALDAKMQFDDNAIYRRPHISNLRDFDEEDPKEVEAAAHGLNYIALE
ncbi:MAG: ATP-grasp domain-containing protein, partial [Pseudomonadota bacterium]